MVLIFFFPHLNKLTDPAQSLEEVQRSSEQSQCWFLKFQLKGFRLDSSQLSAKLLLYMKQVVSYVGVGGETQC